ncbi:MAG: single-stranded DNA-binding protein [Bifidobacteriaceae bacterium]|jgi:single-strand DNA-binding protein|nr:single-stranded DNA-binding protein [Bifidobacteriaceae bacterium]
MANDIVITIVGNLAGDPDLRYTNSNVPYCNFTVASTPSVFNSNTNSWDNGTTVWMRCVAWREIAENIQKSLTKGTRVIVQGRMTENEWQTKEGETRRDKQLTVIDAGPSLFRAVTNVEKTTSNSPAQAAPVQSAPAAPAAPAADGVVTAASSPAAPAESATDPFASPAPAQAAVSEESPF